VLLLAACGGKSSSTNAPSGPPQPLAAGQWANMSKGERAKFMRSTVKPTMQVLFQSFDGKRFATFECGTCHGAGASTGSFQMPNADLPKLTTEDVAHPPPDKADIAEFMKTKVRPEIATLLGIPEWSPEHPDGFGCFDCHTQP